MEKIKFVLRYSAQRIIDEVSHDEVVCLGDYFDDFDDSKKSNKQTAEWLVDFLSKDNHIGLLGNHDISYLYGKKIDYCTGFTSAKNWVINKILKREDWDKLRLYYKVDDIYLTHAGITESLFCHPMHGWKEDYFESKMKEARDELKIGRVNFLLQAGLCRGGMNKYGGVTWCHYPDEFEPIEGIRQIFGHSADYTPRNAGRDNWCIDTGLGHVAIIEDGNISVVNSISYL